MEVAIATSVLLPELGNQLRVGRALERATSPVALLDLGHRVMWSNQSYVNRVERWCPPEAVGSALPVSADVSLVCRRLRLVLGRDGYDALLKRLKSGDIWSGTVILDQTPTPPPNTPVFDCILMPLPDTQGNPASFLLLLHDVTLHHQEKLEHAHAARHDGLTGLGNRLRLKEAVSSLLLRGEAFALFYLDLDGFKGVNDTFGHAVGDEVLKSFAQHLTYVCRETDIPIRLGGDEFVVALPNHSSEASLQAIADRILVSAKMAFAAVNPALTDRVGVSIGGSRYPLNGATQESLMDVADKALYQAKRAGKGCFVLGAADAA